MKIRNIQINHLSHFIGINPTDLTLSWNVEECKKQKAFQIKVFDGSDVIEDSLKIESDKTSYELKNSLGYKKEIKIEVHAFDENENEDTQSILVVTGKDKNDFIAKWINPELNALKKDEDQLGAYLKKEFEVKDFSLAKKAYLYATSHGIMNIYINGKEVSDNCLMPGTQEYDKRLLVETILVTPFLKEGKNEIVVSLGNGWYRGGIGNDHNKNVYGKDIAFLAELEIDNKRVLVSDDTWLASNDGPLGKNDLMEGEEYDARKEKTMTYHKVKVENFSYDNLICRDCEPIVRKEKFEAKEYQNKNGECVYDFGVNLAGYVEFNLNAKEGDKIVIEYGETLDSNGNFTLDNFKGRHINPQREVYICKEGLNIYHPTKTYFGFRYIRVTSDIKTEAKDFIAYAIYSDIRELSTFECSNKDVNQLFSNAIRSMKGNFIDVPTDCPTREKSGFSGDAQAFVDTAFYLLDSYSVYYKWLKENKSSQYKDGCLPQISPKITDPKKKQKMMGIMSLDGGIGWSDAYEIITYKIYERFDDKKILKENYNTIKSWVDYEVKRAKSTRLSNFKLLPRKYRKYMIDKGWMWGEWLEPGQNDVNYMKNLIFHGDSEVGTGFLYLNLDYLVKIATILNKEDDVKKYSLLKDKVREAYRAVFTDNGVIKEEKRQCRFVRAISHDLLSKEEKREACKKLAKLISNNNDHLNTGFLTTHSLNRVLTDYGESKKAFDLLLQREYPSWLYAVSKGCTSIPENWDCYNKEGNPYNSFNHYSYGAIASWLMDSVLGIRVNEGKITLTPHTDSRISYARGSYDSYLGKIYSSWEIKDGKTYYEFDIPANTKADIILGEEIIENQVGKVTFVR